MSTARTPFSIRLRSDLLAPMRAVALYRGITMTSIIEDALEGHLPALMDMADKDLDHRADVARANG